MSTYTSGGPGHVWLDSLYQKKEIWRDLYWFLGVFRDDKNVKWNPPRHSTTKLIQMINSHWNSQIMSDWIERN